MIWHRPLRPLVQCTVCIALQILKHTNIVCSVIDVRSIHISNRSRMHVINEGLRAYL